MHSKWRSNISLIIAPETETILYIVHTLAPGGCPNENFGFQYRICWFCSYSDKYKNVCRTKCRSVRRWDIKDFRGGFERQRSSFDAI